ncbi:reverse transcriptase domain-containing protein [uncultured Trichococcus sp.]|uniref:reverse transcriptase domain-containing protein n=1 Tax=uncultured Trichococcus sp. TaxID=189665 RepID=UPI002A189B85|nr:reverse transcriptase domain-containing protein [uncultured Trichococcus sp.]
MWLVENRTSFRYQKVINTERVIIIKRYCQNADFTNLAFIEMCCYEYLDEKWERNDVSNMFSAYMRIPVKFIKEMEKEELMPAIPKIAVDIKRRIDSGDLNLRPIKYFQKVDGMNGKVRTLGIEEPIHQIMNYVCVNAMKPMFDAKIGIFQCASLPGRGQSYGKKRIESWRGDIRYFVKGDIQKCFPSIPIARLKELLQRDIKNKKINRFAFSLLDMFKGGLSIGSYLSQYLCNYYLSYAYHYASEQLFKVRKSKRNGNKQVRLVNHVLFYMDDFLLTGTSKKDLRKGMRMLIVYINQFLQLTVKPDWKISKFSDGEPIDMMGFVFRKSRTTIRAKIFIKTRRQFLRAQKRRKKRLPISVDHARRVVSAYGWYKHTNTYTVRAKLKVGYLVKECKRIIGRQAREERLQHAIL